MKEGGHRIANDELIVDLGLSCSGAIALHSIAGCSLLDCGRHQGNGDLWSVSPGEQANVFIELKGATLLHITAFGSARDISKKFVALYVDQPDAFVNAMAHVGLVRAA